MRFGIVARSLSIGPLQCLSLSFVVRDGDTCGQRDVDPLLQPSPQRLVDVPGEVGGSEDHHHLRGVIIFQSSPDAWSQDTQQQQH